ncbi:capsular polysaccharide biosynthesis protein [Paracoccaceae bacterium GXU_MW_L88]
MAARGRWLARRRGLPVVTIEDAPLRSIAPGDPWPVGFLLDATGVHFDGRAPSDAETAILAATEDDTERARAGIAFLQAHHLSKYNEGDSTPLPGSYVLVVDQTASDASLLCAGRTEFLAMLGEARAAHPDEEIIILTHPEIASGRKQGHFRQSDLDANMRFVSGLTPWAALSGASAVYCWSSQLGLDAILAGLRPQSFGWPIWAGWGLSNDRQSFPRRIQRSREQLFAGLYLHHARWIDPFRETATDFETAARQLLSRRDHACRTKKGAVLMSMSPWKRGFLRRFFVGDVSFAEADDAVRLAEKTGRPLIRWASRDGGLSVPNMQYMEDGFLRSVGLGAALVPPASLIIDDLGVHYDPSRESRLERLISKAEPTPRAAALGRAIIGAKVSKYNVGHHALDDLRARAAGRKIILVPGQVEDDASVIYGAPGLGNADLLAQARDLYTHDFLVYKPHPDVEAGLRLGVIDAQMADYIARETNAAELLDLCDAVVTLTSLMGFEALLRGKAVTCLGTPFYAGWGLTCDLAKTPARRAARPSIDALVQAALIDYPLYVDPVTGLGCGPEDILARLEARDPRLAKARPAHRGVAELLPFFKGLK